MTLLIIRLGVVSILRMPKDIFPEISEPIVTLIWQYGGIPADAFEKQITATSQTIIPRMPSGRPPTQIVQYDASSAPTLQIALGSDTLSEQQLYDQGLWLVRNEVVPVPGAIVPLPHGGRPRLVMIDADPVRMHAKGFTVKDINDALNRQNVNLPTGLTQIGSRDYVLSINNSPEKISELGALPVRSVGQRDTVR